MKGATLQSKVIKLLFSNGYYVVNVVRASKRGVPDILACKNGHFFGIEIKGAGDTLKPLQKHNLDQIKKCGGTALVVKELSDIENLI